MRTFATLGFATISCICITSCSRGLSDDLPTEDLDIAALEVALEWSNPTVDVVVNLLNRYDALERYGDGQATFASLAAIHEGDDAYPWLLAAEGLFQVQNNRSVSLLNRVGFVEEGVAKLDRAVELDGGLPRYLRGVVLVALPDRFDEAARGVEDLEWVLDNAESFPVGVRRGALRALADGYAAVGRVEAAARALGESGHAGTDEEGLLATGFSVTAESGFRFQPPVLRTVADGIHHAEAYDFGDMSFVETPDGLVVIDSGTFPENSAAALAAVREITSAPVQTLILTHAHWDHVGGAATFAGAEIVVESHFDEELVQVRLANPPAFRWFFSDREVPLDVVPTQIVDEPTTLANARRIELVPVKGGETDDALVVHVPDAGVVFVGDIFMPYLGAPFTEEGNPVALLDTIDTIVALEPNLLLHGHPPLTELWTIDHLPVLRDALAVLVEATMASIRDGRTLAATLRDNVLPDVLATDPGAVLPYLTMRQGVVKRLYDLNTGYWQSDRRGVEILARSDWARALDELGGGERGYLRTVEALLDSGEAALPLQLVDIALVNHPDSERLRDLRDRALQRLRRLNSQNDPFKFIVYSEESGTEMQPLAP